MKRTHIKSFLGVGILCLAVGVSGCMSIPTSPSSRFYALSAVNENRVSNKINIASDVIIGIGPVNIPEYLNRPQMVTMDKSKMLQFAQFDRWGESLDLGLARLIREDLTAVIPTASLTLFPWNPSIAVKYQVVLEVVQLENEFDRGMYFVVQWTVLDLPNSKVLTIKRTEFRTAITPPNYSGLAKTLSTDCASLSRQIAQEIGSLMTNEKPPQKKSSNP